MARVRFGTKTSRQPESHINSGHLICGREFFDRLQGFDESLQTGEDVDLCARARSMGGVISPNPMLRVIHRGYPTSLRAFFRREWWHGLGDFTTMRKFLSSWVAVSAVLFFALHVALLAGLVAGWSAVWQIAAFSVVGSCLGLAASRRAPKSLSQLLVASLLYYVYLWARALSPLYPLLGGRRSR